MEEKFDFFLWCIPFWIRCKQKHEHSSILFLVYFSYRLRHQMKQLTQLTRRFEEDVHHLATVFYPNIFYSYTASMYRVRFYLRNQRKMPLRILHTVGSKYSPIKMCHVCEKNSKIQLKCICCEQHTKIRLFRCSEKFILFTEKLMLLLFSLYD